MCSQRSLYLIRKTRVTQILDGRVHRHGQMPTRIEPDATLAQCSIQDPARQRLDQAGVFGKRNEGIRRDKPSFGVPPAHECLSARHATRAQLDLRLEVQHELVALDCKAQIPNQAEPLRCVLILFWRVQRESAVIPLRDIHRHISAPKQRHGIVAVIGRYCDADACTYVEAITGHDERRAKRSQERLGGGAGARRIVRGQEYGEFVTAQAHDQVRVGQGAAEARTNLLEQHVAVMMPKGVVDLLEAIQVHGQQHH